MSVFNFKSAASTSREQSERLLALGIKPETADMSLCYMTHDIYGKEMEPRFLGCIAEPMQCEEMQTILFSRQKFYPAWSLHRLIEMLRSRINISKDLPSINHDAYLRMYKASVSYIWFNCDGEEKILVGFYDDGFFGAVVDAIEWLIKEGYFNKEYLENGNC